MRLMKLVYDVKQAQRSSSKNTASSYLSNEFASIFRISSLNAETML